VREGLSLRDAAAHINGKDNGTRDER
jgi:hypothetical protein